MQARQLVDAVLLRNPHVSNVCTRLDRFKYEKGQHVYCIAANRVFNILQIPLINHTVGELFRCKTWKLHSSII